MNVDLRDVGQHMEFIMVRLEETARRDRTAALYAAGVAEGFALRLSDFAKAHQLTQQEADVLDTCVICSITPEPEVIPTTEPALRDKDGP